MKKISLFLLAAALLAMMNSCHKKTAAPTVSQATSTDTVTAKEEDCSDFVLLTDSIPGIILEIRYYSSHNFVGSRIDGYDAPVAIATKECASALAKAAAIFLNDGYRIKVYDAYRPQKAVDHFVRWGKDVADTLTKQYFYPDIDKATVFEKGYVATQSSHTRGSTVDLTLFDMKQGRDVDMGGPFDWFGSLSDPMCEQVTPEQHAARMYLRQVMIQCGFKPYDGEWWHFTLNNEPFPNTYFTFPLRADL